MAARSGDSTIRIEGLKELQQGLRAMDGDMARSLRFEQKEIAAQVATAARARAESLGGVAKHVAPSIRPGALQTASLVAIGGANYPMAMGANFGAHHDVLRNTSRGPMLGWNQFPEPVKPDRILFATVDAERELILRDYEAMIDRLSHLAFPD